MSTDLHLHYQLPNLRMSDDAVNLHDLEKEKLSTPDHDNISTLITPHQKENENDASGAVPVFDAADESYKTPTSKESKIPEILTCPPAPKKPKAFVSCKRKLLDEFQFFEVTTTNNEDMDAFLRSTFPKRTCPCT